MHMAWHNAPAINFHSFLFSAIVQTGNQYPAVLFANKNINPINSGKADKVKTFFIGTCGAPAGDLPTSKSVISFFNNF